MFAVFGVSKEKCRERVEKDAKYNLNPVIFAEAITKLTDELYEKNTRACKISPFYTTKREADSYASLVESGGFAKKLSIKQRYQDGVNEKTGRPVMRWKDCL